MNLRDFAFVKDADALDFTEVEIDGRPFRIITPTLEQSSRIESAVGEVYTDDNGEKAVRLNTAELQVRCCIDLVTDPEDEEYLFTELDRKLILGAKKGSRLARLAEAAAEAFLAVGNGPKSTSEDQPNSDSSADSPKISESEPSENSEGE